MADIYHTLQRMRGGETRQEVMLDFALGSLNLKKEGEDGFGYHISDSEEFSRIPSVYVILEDGQYRILGWSRSLSAVGTLILELLEKQDLNSAQRWLDDVVHDLNSIRGTSNRPAVRLLWSGVVESTRGAEAATAAAASLIGQDYASEKAISLLKDRSSKTKDKMDRAQIDLALCESLEKAQKWGDLLITAQNLSAYRIYENDSFYFTTTALYGLKRWNELSVEAEKQLKKKPDDSRAARMMATALVNMGKYDEAATYFKKMIGRIMAFDELPYAVWGLMLTGKVDEQTLKEISQIGLSNSSDYFYASGALKVLLDRSDEAQKSLDTALDQDEPLNAKTWALRGRILESYGLADEAKAAYEKMQAFKNNDEETDWAIRVLTGRTNR
jgi:tetratricopeptide (TPR) repeat protein